MVGPRLCPLFNVSIYPPGRGSAPDTGLFDVPGEFESQGPMKGINRALVLSPFSCSTFWCEYLWC